MGRVFFRRTLEIDNLNTFFCIQCGNKYVFFIVFFLKFVWETLVNIMLHASGESEEGKEEKGLQGPSTHLTRTNTFLLLLLLLFFSCSSRSPPRRRTGKEGGRSL